jgi:CHAT domain-containing protein/tetratricopeptide (TPR) repeat protein
MMDKNTWVVAAFPAAGRLSWLLVGPLMLLPAVAIQAAGGEGARSPGALLAQASVAASSAIPPEVQGWFDTAKVAAGKGDVAEALRLQRRVLAWLQANRPAPDVFKARALINLGLFLSKAGQRQDALPPTLEAERILRQLQTSQPEARHVLALALNNQGKFLGDLGRGPESLAPTEEAVKIWRELVKTNPAHWGNLAAALTNLGVIYSELGRRREALALAIEAVQVFRKQPRTDPSVLGDLPLAVALTSLGVRYSDLGRRQEALAPTEEAVKISRALVQTNSAYLGGLARSLGNLGLWYGDLGRWREALAPSEEAVQIFRYLAKTNPAFQEYLARNATNLATLQVKLGNTSAALRLMRETVGSEVTHLQGQLPLLPEGRRQALVEAFGQRWQVPFSMARQGEAGAALALFTRLNRQGLLQDIQRSQSLLARSGPWRTVFEQVTAVTAELANITLTTEQRSLLLARKEQLEQMLYHQLPQIKPQLVEASQIAALLPADGVLVEFQRYWPHDANLIWEQSFSRPRYLALLLRPDGKIRAIPLGEAAPIDAAVAAAVSASADAKQQVEAHQRLAAVSRLVLAPLQKDLAGVRELFVSPDGELNRLPFAALPVAAADGPTLGDVVGLRLLTTGRDLLRLRQPAKAGGAAVLIANPDFNNARPPSGTTNAAVSLLTQPSTETAAATTRGSLRRSAGERGFPTWNPLPGTEQEARQLAPLLGGIAVIRGPAATASVVLSQRAPRILHIATHGFFMADLPPEGDSALGAAAGPTTTATLVGSTGKNTSMPSSSLDDPLQRSGLVFAGANNPGADPVDDGYLTAAEAIAMGLEGTELVTLSACETGLGGFHSGEGVYGLQRSLAVAGARSSLLSLWKVDDDMTATFMVHYYNLLKAGEGRADALRKTQNFFRTNKFSNYNDIRVWGAFQLSGDWRSIQRW